ncbi:MAG: hypothetical protein HOY78_29970 [Saccharothrix sp.]|nr:hypothetical protein [Saccharothrix sp.]
MERNPAAHMAKRRFVRTAPGLGGRPGPLRMPLSTDSSAGDIAVMTTTVNVITNCTTVIHVRHVKAEALNGASSE